MNNEDYTPHEKCNPPSFIGAENISLKDRTDIVAKYLYAPARLKRAPDFLDGIDVEKIYRQHIHIRTGGQEPGDEQRKGSIEDFINQFNDLINSFNAKGFISSCAVPMSSINGLPINGAHRIATALALGIQVPCNLQDFPGGLWDLDWFIKSGFRQEEINIIVKAIAHLKPNNFLVSLLWSPVEEAWETIEAEINQSAPVIFSRTLEFPRAAFNEMICDIYSYDWGPQVGDNILRKISLLSDFPTKIRIVFSELNSHNDINPKKLKEDIREKYSHMSPVDRFTTIYISESVTEMRHLLNIFCSENNLIHLSKRSALRPEFVAMLANYNQVLRSHRLDPVDCCIVGGAILDVLGLRSSTDIDFTPREAVRFKYFDGGVTHLADGIDVVAFNYPRSFSQDSPLSDEQIIKRPNNHFFSRGLKFVDPSIALTRRQHQRRDKDLQDLKSLSRYLDKYNH